MMNFSEVSNPRKNIVGNKANGRFSLRKVDGYLRFILFIVLIGMGYIWNAHNAEVQVKRKDKLREEVKKLKAEYIIRRSDLSAATRYTNMTVNIDSLRLRRLKTPPFKLVKAKKQNTETAAETKKQR